jgi:hypothetical protein
MKKTTTKLRLSKSTVSNLSQSEALLLKGGVVITNYFVCRTWGPKYCGTTLISDCSQCISCIECNPPAPTD